MPGEGGRGRFGPSFAATEIRTLGKVDHDSSANWVRQRAHDREKVELRGIRIGEPRRDGSSDEDESRKWRASLRPDRRLLPSAASAGLIITEGTFPSQYSQAYTGEPGIETKQQVIGWSRVADAVHERGGAIVVQIKHGGRAAHPAINGGHEILAPSAIAIQGDAHAGAEKVPFAIPRAMTGDHLRTVVAEHVTAARRAVDAGLDGVEIHSANGYLLHQFLAPSSNHRSDGYGGIPVNRARFAAEVVEAVAAEIGGDRVGIRISPAHNIQDVFESDAADVLATYGALIDRVRPIGLAYLSIVHADPANGLVQELGSRFGGKVIVNTGFSSQTSREDAESLLQLPHIDAVVVGRALIANPDLVERWRVGHPENKPRPELFYAFNAEGYTDCPFMDR